jgi:hypothetical protein
MEAVHSSKISAHLIATQHTDPKDDHSFISMFMKVPSQIAIFVTNFSPKEIQAEIVAHVFRSRDPLVL